MNSSILNYPLIFNQVHFLTSFILSKVLASASCSDFGIIQRKFFTEVATFYRLSSLSFTWVFFLHYHGARPLFNIFINELDQFPGKDMFVNRVRLLTRVLFLSAD